MIKHIAILNNFNYHVVIDRDRLRVGCESKYCLLVVKRGLLNLTVKDNDFNKSLG